MTEKLMKRVIGITGLGMLSRVTQVCVGWLKLVATFVEKTGQIDLYNRGGPGEALNRRVSYTAWKSHMSICAYQIQHMRVEVGAPFKAKQMRVHCVTILK